jgi:hypothetical protein
MAKAKKLTGVTVTVTAADIQRGSAADPLRCPIALAMKRVTRRKVCVNVAEVHVGNVGSRDVYELPRRADRFMDAFDFGHPVKPFSFKIGRKLNRD